MGGVIDTLWGVGIWRKRKDSRMQKKKEIPKKKNRKILSRGGP